MVEKPKPTKIRTRKEIEEELIANQDERGVVPFDVRKKLQEELAQTTIAQEERNVRTAADRRTIDRGGQVAKGETIITNQQGQVIGTEQSDELQGLINRQQEELANLRTEDFTQLLPQGQEPSEVSNLNLIPTIGAANTIGNVLRGDEELARQQAQKAAIGSGATLAATGAVLAAPAAAASLAPVGAAIKSIGAPVLALSGLSFAGVFDLVTSGRVSDLEGDISEIGSISRDVVTDVSNGADVNEAIDSLTEAEQEIRWKIGELNVAIKRSPKDRLRGKDTQTLAYSELNQIIRRRQALERYAFDGDLTALQRVTGAATPTQ